MFNCDRSWGGDASVHTMSHQQVVQCTFNLSCCKISGCVCVSPNTVKSPMKSVESVELAEAKCRVDLVASL